jgi:hypothetical protein
MRSTGVATCLSAGLVLLLTASEAEARCKYGLTRFSYFATYLYNVPIGEVRQHWQRTMGGCSPKSRSSREPQKYVPRREDTLGKLFPGNGPRNGRGRGGYHRD